MGRSDQKLLLLAERHTVALTDTVQNLKTNQTKIKQKQNLFKMVSAFYLSIHFISVNGSHLVSIYQHYRSICNSCLP